jgi:transcription factor WhiB
MPDFAAKRHDIPGAIELAEMIRDGWTLADTGTLYHTSARAIQARLNDAGYTLGGEVRTAKRAPVKPPTGVATKLMPADADVTCADPAYRGEFEAVLDAQYASKPNKEALSLAQRRAKAVCGMCPVQEICLRVLGPSPHTFGVVGGATDAERKKMFGKKAS